MRRSLSSEPSDAITTRERLRELLEDDRSWWLKHVPHLAETVRRMVATDDEDALQASIERSRRHRVARLEFLIEEGCLEGEALHSIVKREGRKASN